MPDEIAHAAEVLKTLSQPVSPTDTRFQEVREILAARDEVLARYQVVFGDEHLPALSADEFRSFLSFRNNHHWKSLDRLGSDICKDMSRLRHALQTLLDESRPIPERLNEIVRPQGKAFVKRLNRAVLTPILMIRYPEKYGVWNRVSEGGMKILRIWPELERGLTFGERYERINAILLKTADATGVDLWSLDGLWWRLDETFGLADADDAGAPADRALAEVPGIAEGFVEARQRFGLEKHLHEFLRDNWQNTSLGREWQIYEEDGDTEAGYEYPCDIGRIDLLARHRKEPRWLVVELKRGQTGDQTVGQLLRYMGWVKNKLAGPDESVEGIVIAHDVDDSIRYALSVTTNVGLQVYEVEFRLKSPSPLPDRKK